MKWEEIYADRVAMSFAVAEDLANRRSDICEHMPTLRMYASHCSHVTEFGSRNGCSTSALLCGLLDRGDGVLRSYDIAQTGLSWPLAHEGVKWEFIQANTFDLPAIEETDLLFVDSCHDYAHIKKELTHESKVRSWIIMHDTAKAWVPHGGEGPRRARDEFLSENPQWEMHYEAENCNGLSILVRKPITR